LDQFYGEGDDGGVEELGFVDAYDVDLLEEREKGFAEVLYGGYGAGFVCLFTMTCDGCAVVAEVDVGLVAGYSLAGYAGSFEAADELF
jgi:hypothetical protein